MTKDQARAILLKLISDLALKRVDFLTLEMAVEVLYNKEKEESKDADISKD